mmetsp:Transcript_17758/g.20459  ORF Transcript_17758/g.20459 Transcript_17758/m.20459 type:complete len:116 (+) Transcript_17758:113-460(+)
MVDVAAICTIAQIATTKPSVPVTSNIMVIVVYMGSEHMQTILEFFVAHMGFTREGLLCGKQNNVKPTAWLVRKMEWEDKESRLVDLPNYLHDFGSLYPVPKNRKERCQEKEEEKR